MAKQKKYRGLVPAGPGWSLIGENADWYVYANSQLSNEWRNVRVVAKKPRPVKGNYSMAWNGERWADNNCFKAMREHQPEMLNWLDGLMLVV